MTNQSFIWPEFVGVVPPAFRSVAPEVEVFGIYMPLLLMIAVGGFFLAWGIERLLEHRNWSQHIWQLPLFFIALTILFTSVLGLLLLP